LEACLIVKNSAGHKLAYVYFEDEPGRQSAAKLLSKDEARRIASNIAKLPDLLRKDSGTREDEPGGTRRPRPLCRLRQLSAAADP
jgi:hypothetical protein